MLPLQKFNHLESFAFPECAKQALGNLDLNLGQLDVKNFNKSIVENFIFVDHPCAAVRRFRRPPPLYPIEELQLIVVIMDWFQEPRPELTSNAIFLAVFERYLNPMRIRILGKLVSISLSCGVKPVLRAAGVWMNQMGGNWREVLEVAKMLATDFTQYCHQLPEALLELPMSAPRLAVNLMTAFGAIYLQRAKELVPPPDMLLNLIIHWVKNHPEVCMSWKLPIELPEHMTTTSAMTPFAGLFRWTIFGPTVAPTPAYGELHLLLLKMVYEHQDAEEEAINVGHLCFIAKQFSYIAENRAAEQFTATDTFDRCMDRMAQAAHFGLTQKNTMRKKKLSLIHSLGRLPPHGVVQVVMQEHKSKLQN